MGKAVSNGKEEKRKPEPETEATDTARLPS